MIHLQKHILVIFPNYLIIIQIQMLIDFQLMEFYFLIIFVKNKYPNKYYPKFFNFLINYKLHHIIN